MKKKPVLIFCGILLACLLCSCSYTYSVDGYENFDKRESHYELNHYILPSDDFVELFQNIGIDYYYREEEQSILRFVEKSFIVINYEAETYELAKEYCLQNMQLSDVKPLEYNGYTFIENIELAVAQNRYENSGDFPEWFNMFAYNDNMKCLVFMGFYESNYPPADATEVRKHWSEFIEKHFSDVYDWKNTQGDSGA